MSKKILTHSKLRIHRGGLSAWPNDWLGQDFADDMPVDVGEAALYTVVVEGELFVVEAEEVERGGVQVMEGMNVFGGLESEFVGGAMADAGFDASAG